MTSAILTCEEVRAAEQMGGAGGDSAVGIDAEGRAGVCRCLARRIPEGRVVVLAGPGNNGGDAFVAAQRLRDLGRNVWVFDLAPKGERSLEGQNALAGLNGARQPLEDLRLAPDDIVLDGLFGAGLSRPLTGEAAFAIEQVNASGVRVVAD